MPFEVEEVTELLFLVSVNTNPTISWNTADCMLTMAITKSSYYTYYYSSNNKKPKMMSSVFSDKD